MTNKGYQAYLKYLAIQRHFESDYDYFKYNGKTSATLSSYHRRSDWHSFEKLARICADTDCIEGFLVANYLEGNKWVKQMRKPVYDKWTNKMNSLPYLFKDDMREIKEYGPGKIFQFETGEMPPIVNWMATNKYNLESFIILNEVWNFFDRLCLELDDVSFIWPDVKRKFLNYKPFVVKKVKDLILYKRLMKEVFIDSDGHSNP